MLLFTAEHEVFFKQKRIGRYNRPFYIWKFATMLKNSADIGTREITIRNDPRVTKVGKFLRITKINELPQLVNVIAGDMSIVGPRPLMEVSHKLYPVAVSEKIYSCRPGITGIGSVVFRDEEELLSKSQNPRALYQLIFAHKSALELWYHDNRSFSTDMKILFITLWSVFFPKNNLLHKLFKNLPHNDFGYNRPVTSV